MWEVYIGQNLYKEYPKEWAAQRAKERLEGLGHQDVTIIGAGSSHETAPVQIDALPYSMRKAA